MSLKVLIIDADRHFAAKATRYLEAHAHLVVHQPAATLALAQIKHWRPDLVILAADAAENGLAGKIFALPNRPAVLLTEHMDAYARAWRAWQMGGDELLMKPVFTAGEFRQAVTTALENAACGTRAYATAAPAAIPA